jgi:hypothetical protein
MRVRVKGPDPDPGAPDLPAWPRPKGELERLQALIAQRRGAAFTAGEAQVAVQAE